MIDWGAYLEVAAVLHDLPLDAARRDEVIEQLQRIELLARSVVDYPLGPEVEPAPVFRA